MPCNCSVRAIPYPAKNNGAKLAHHATTKRTISGPIVILCTSIVEAILAVMIQTTAHAARLASRCPLTESKQSSSMVYCLLTRRVCMAKSPSEIPRLLAPAGICREAKSLFGLSSVACCSICRACVADVI